jgi:antitoxin component YwqK of YwqJK toxin-antitoxin module
MRILIIFWALFSALIASSQTIDTRSMSVKENSIAQNFSVFTEEKNIKPQNSLIYFYYRDDKLFQTQGSFSGWLLHGKYESFYADKALQSQGLFKLGLKNSEWKYWYPNGFLKSVETWSNGIKTGYFAEYNDKGILLKTGQNKNGFINGKVLVYNERNEIIETLIYKRGIPEQPKTKKVAIAATGNQ